MDVLNLLIIGAEKPAFQTMPSLVTQGRRLPRIVRIQADIFMRPDIRRDDLLTNKNLILIEFPDEATEKASFCVAACDFLQKRAVDYATVFPQKLPPDMTRLIEENSAPCIAGAFDLGNLRGENGLFSVLRKLSIARNDRVAAINREAAPLSMAIGQKGDAWLDLGKKAVRLTVQQTKMIAFLADRKFHGSDRLFAAMDYRGCLHPAPSAKMSGYATVPA